MSYSCKECGFNLWLPIVDPGGGRKGLGISHLGLYNDGRFPGRSLLVLSDHHEELALLSRPLANLFMEDIQIAGKAIQKAVGAVRMNYAILGNAVPHVHCHIIPRFGDKDPGPNTTPWSTNTKVWKMEKKRYEQIIADIRENLE